MGARAVAVVLASTTLGTLLAACGSGPSGAGTSPRSRPTTNREAPMTMTLSSALFADDAMIPTRSTCDGEDVSPPLTWDGVPAGAAELALTMVDPDAPGGTFVHWVVWGIDPATHELDEGVLPDGVHQGRTGFGKTGYGGPCPPKGDQAHRYVFTIYALSSPVALADGASIDDLRSNMDGKVLAEGTLVGRYGR